MKDSNDKSIFEMDVSELQQAWTRTFCSKRVLVAAPVALAVGAPIVALGAPAVVGAMAGMGAAISVFRKRGNSRKGKNK